MEATQRTGWLSGSRVYVLTMLTLIYVLNMVDRKIITIIQEPIKLEFGLADWQLGLMTGFAFAAVYAVAGIPLARFADHPTIRRVDIVAAALVVWSAATAACGLAQNYTQMLLSRFAVGIGEAGSGPSSQSLIADHFGRHERGRAMGVFALASPIGIAFGLSIGGVMADLFSWRTSLLLVGLPGIALAIVFRRTVAEPVRGLSEGRSGGVLVRPTLLAVVRTLLRKKTFVLLVSGGCFAAFGNLGVQYWFPSFFMRSFDMTLGQVGFAWGFASGLAGMVGTFAGGWLVDKFGKKSPRYILIVPAIAMTVLLPFHIGAVLSGEWHFALILLLVPTALGTVWVAPNMVLNQGLAPLAMRSTVVAISTFLVNMIGLGFGPVVLGYVSDLFTAAYGSNEIGLRYALIAMSPSYLIAAALFFAGSFFVARDLEPVPAGEPAPKAGPH